MFTEALAAAMNPSVAGGNHGAVHVEHQVVRWFAGLAGYPADSTGLLVSGGSMATLTALAVARHRAAARIGMDVRATGLQGIGRDRADGLVPIAVMATAGKWLYAPVDAGLVLVRDRGLTRDTFSLVPPYLRTDDDPDGVGGPAWFSEYGFEQTRLPGDRS